MRELSRGAAGLCLAVLTTVAIVHDTGCSSVASRGRSEQPAVEPSGTSTPEAPPAQPSDEDGEPLPPGTPPPSGPVGSTGNHGIRGFDEAKKEAGRIYAAAGQRIDLYCGCTFAVEPGKGMRVDLAACGYVPARDAARAERIEWEHAVPAAAFGHTFAEWREGSPKCVDTKGKRFKGRKCARSASAEFARIEADLHNLFPVVGEVNGLRGDLPMGVLDPPDRAHAHANAGGTSATFHFGKCSSAIEGGVFMPRREVRGDLARAYLYMNLSYPERGLVDDAHRAVFEAWDKEDPPDAWERERNSRIAARQGNANAFIRN
ncbi:MAG: Endonuclease [Myxococcaceae bacterium]|nr:Endonuclease [Myxococcaceae bacterium]